MIIFPAIDLKDGKCVRLKQGDFNQLDVFGEDPKATAAKWQSQGGKYLHVVDLDGALEGKTVNRQAIREIVEVLDIPLQIGGGIRNEETVNELFKLGVSRLILGTSALKDKEFTKKMIETYKEKIAVSIDAKNGKVAINGWLDVSETNAFDLGQELVAMGLKTLVYTDIAKDGMLAGPNFEELEKMNELDLDIIASGGVTTPEDVKKLKEMNLYGAIIGKALYTGAINLEEVV